MCRFLAYLGPPVGLENLVWGPARSVVRQSWASRHQAEGAVNADGFGIGWYDRAVRPEPARWRSTRPAWAEHGMRSVAGLTRTTCALAVVRDATPPGPIDESGTPPFTAGPWLFAHNGAIDGFRGPSGVRLRRAVSDLRAAAIEGGSDSEVVFALVLDRLDAGTEPGAALAEVVILVRSIAPANLNLVLTDGTLIVATASGASLFALEAPGAVTIASEPYDDDRRWHPVPDGSLVRADASGMTVTPLTPAGRTQP